MKRVHICKSFATTCAASERGAVFQKKPWPITLVVRPADVVSVERGECRISIDDIERLALALGVEPADLLRALTIELELPRADFKSDL